MACKKIRHALFFKGKHLTGWDAFLLYLSNDTFEIARMERKKQIKVFNSFQELEADELKRGINMSLQEHFETFFKMREFHNLFFSEEKIDKTINDSSKKRIIISKPEWI